MTNALPGRGFPPSSPARAITRPAAAAPGGRPPLPRNHRRPAPRAAEAEVRLARRALFHPERRTRHRVTGRRAWFRGAALRPCGRARACRCCPARRRQPSCGRSRSADSQPRKSASARAGCRPRASRERTRLSRRPACPGPPCHGAGSILNSAPSSSSVTAYNRPSGPCRTSRMR
jgi:hypothetical protein